MPTLPTITVTQAQADRMLAAFGSAEAYKTWLLNGIVDYVLTKESNERYNAYLAADGDARSKVRTELSQ